MKSSSSNKSIIFYGTPAHGHINASTAIVKALTDHGFRVVYYATEEFRKSVEKSGAVFAEYDFGDITFETSVGSQILKLSELILKFSSEKLDELTSEAKKINPILIIHDTIAFWGRAVSHNLNVSAVSVNTFLTAYSYTSKTALMYAMRFSFKSLREIDSIPNIIKYRKIVKHKYGIKKTDILNLIMNGENLNVFTYPRSVHPDGQRFKENCFFLGPSSAVRDSGKPEEITNSENLIYVSLGTIFNDNMLFWEKILSQFGNTKYNLLISCGSQAEKLSKIQVPKNITFKRSVNQPDVLKKAILFISAGGINSISEAASNGVPCLLCPQQSEQKIMSEVIQKLGLGKILKNYDRILDESESLLNAFNRNEELINEFKNVRMDELIDRIEKYIEKTEN